MSTGFSFSLFIFMTDYSFGYFQEGIPLHTCTVVMSNQRSSFLRRRCASQIEDGTSIQLCRLKRILPALESTPSIFLQFPCVHISITGLRLIKTSLASFYPLTY